jgi:nucleotide-binding universal stress UspA family protein
MANPDGLPDNPLYERILVPLDGSQRAENVLPVITQLAHFHKSNISLVQVIQTPEMARQMPPSPDDIELSSRVIARNREEAGRYLEQLKSRSTLEGVTIQTHLISSDNAAASLHQIVEQEHINMVALSAHGFSGNLNWPYGSMVNNFFMYGTVPLLVVQDLPAKLEQAPVEMPIGERAER